MKSCTRSILVPFAFGAMGCFALVFAGCERKPAPPKLDPTSPQSYMNDEKFRGQLDERRKARVKLEREHGAIAAKMAAMIDATRQKLKTDDLNQVKAVLDKDPEWQRLYTACTNAKAQAEANHRETLGVVRRRLLGKEKISK